MYWLLLKLLVTSRGKFWTLDMILFAVIYPFWTLIPSFTYNFEFTIASPLTVRLSVYTWLFIETSPDTVSVEFIETSSLTNSSFLM